MSEFRSGIGQNADRAPRRRSLQARNSHVIGTALGFAALGICRDSGVETTLAAPFAAGGAQRFARCPK
jgi:hypothetical protein